MYCNFCVINEPFMKFSVGVGDGPVEEFFICYECGGFTYEETGKGTLFRDLVQKVTDRQVAKLKEEEQKRVVT